MLSLGERIYCIVNDITQIKCLFCENNKQFYGFMRGYSKVCNKKECKDKYGNEVQSNGLTRFEVISQNTIKTKTTKLTPEGITVAQAAGRKSRDTLRQRYGEDYFSKFSLKKCEELRNTIFEDGTNGLTQRALKAADVKRNKIVDGLDGNQRCALSSANTMKQVQADGLTQYEKNAIKCQETKMKDIDENGNNVSVRASLKAAETKRHKIDPETGLSVQELQIKKSNIYRETNIDEFGLNGFERSFAHGAGRCKLQFYKNTNIVYQGNLEEDFLDKLVGFDIFQNVQRAKHIMYTGIDGKMHRYHPDFILVPLNYFEVKCSWTYDCNSKDIDIRQINHLKWKGLLENIPNSKFFLIWEKKFILQLFLEDFKSINELHIPSSKNFIEFNKDNLLKLIN